MNIYRNKHRFILTSVSSIAILMASSFGTVHAQDNDDADEVMEEVVSTGSRLKRSEFATTVPTMAMDASDIKMSGFNELSELIRELPSIAEATSAENSQSSTQNSGSSTIALRNLGSDRTLVLIDGRRTVSNSSTSNVVSLDTIPSGFIERIEVITGGASAVYGSDAVTGVVNLITRDKFEGLELDFRYGNSQHGGGVEKTAELTAGANFSDDRGNVLFNFTYDEEEAIYEYDRDFALINTDIEGDFNGSGNIPGGRFRGDDYGEVDANGVWSPGYDDYDFRGPETISIPKERYLLAGKITFDLTENITTFFHGQLSHVSTRSQRAPDTAGSNKFISSAPYTDPITGVVTYHEGIPLDNPFIPVDLLADAIGDGDKSIQFRRRWTELGNRWRGGVKNTYRFWAGLKGSIQDNWDWEVSYGHHEYRQSQNRVGDLVIPLFAFAVNVEDDPDRPGEYRCKDAGARAGGCVPLNVFGEGAVSPEAAEYVKLVDSLNARNVEKNVGGHIAGDLFELPAGSLGIAAGFEWRSTTTRTTWDPISKAGLGTVTGQTDQFGKIDVKGLYVEANIPLLADKNFAKYLGIELAGRVDDYSSVGKVYSYKAGASWVVTEGFRLRGAYARAQRAPNTIELFATGIGSQGPISEGNDPCDGVTASSTGTVAANCLSEAGILANLADNGGVFMRNFDEQVQSPLRGNLSVKEETADTYTVGFVFTPEAVSGLSLSVDYYDIRIKDAIGDINENDILARCYGSENFTTNAFCNEITRDALSGDLVSVNRTYVNLTSLRSTGIDTALAYNFEIDGVGGDFSFKLLHSYIINLNQEAVDPDGEVIFEDNKGIVGTRDRAGGPKHKARVSLAWRNGKGLTLRWKSVIYGAANDIDYDPEQDTSGFVHDLQYGSYIRNDFFASYDLENVLGGGATLYGGINNLFDKNPPLMLDGAESESVANTNSIYDIVGRYFYAGVQFRF